MKHAILGGAIAILSLTAATPAAALNILLTNDDGFTSNVKALAEALKRAGHDVVVSVPCTGQSGRAGAIVMYSTETITADNDGDQVNAAGGCLNGAAAIGDPAVGPFTKDGYTDGTYFYAHGTPVMATAYGLDIAGAPRWDGAPDLVLSGPNEGQNVGPIVVHSGTIGNVQFAMARGIPAVALSAGSDTADNDSMANPKSAIVADLTVNLVASLQASANGGPLLPPGVALNVNFPTEISADTGWAFSRIGTYSAYNLRFRDSAPWGITASRPDADPTDAQAEDESIVYRDRIAVSAMQAGYDHRAPAQAWLRLRLNTLESQ